MWLFLLCPGFPKILLRCWIVLTLDFSYLLSVKEQVPRVVPSQMFSIDCDQNWATQAIGHLQIERVGKYVHFSSLGGFALAL